MTDRDLNAAIEAALGDDLTCFAPDGTERKERIIDAIHIPNTMVKRSETWLLWEDRARIATLGEDYRQSIDLAESKVLGYRAEPRLFDTDPAASHWLIEEMKRRALETGEWFKIEIIDDYDKVRRGMLGVGLNAGRGCQCAIWTQAGQVREFGPTRLIAIARAAPAALKGGGGVAVMWICDECKTPNDSGLLPVSTGPCERCGRVRPCYDSRPLPRIDPVTGGVREREAERLRTELLTHPPPARRPVANVQVHVDADNADLGALDNIGHGLLVKIAAPPFRLRQPRMRHEPAIVQQLADGPGAVDARQVVRPGATKPDADLLKVRERDMGVHVVVDREVDRRSGRLPRVEGMACRMSAVDAALSRREVPVRRGEPVLPHGDDVEPGLRERDGFGMRQQVLEGRVIEQVSCHPAVAFGDEIGGVRREILGAIEPFG